MTKKLAAILSVFVTLLAVPAWALPASSSDHSSVGIQRPAQQASVPRGVSLGTPNEDQRYAAREAASAEAKQFRGGDTIVISATAVAIALLVVLILILI